MRYVQKCTQQQKWQKREHNGEFGKYANMTILPESPTRQSNEGAHKSWRIWEIWRKLQYCQNRQQGKAQSNERAP